MPGISRAPRSGSAPGSRDPAPRRAGSPRAIGRISPQSILPRHRRGARRTGAGGPAQPLSDDAGQSAGPSSRGSAVARVGRPARAGATTRRKRPGSTRRGRGGGRPRSAEAADPMRASRRPVIVARPHGCARSEQRHRRAGRRRRRDDRSQGGLPRLLPLQSGMREKLLAPCPRRRRPGRRRAPAHAGCFRRPSRSGRPGRRGRTARGSPEGPGRGPACRTAPRALGGERRRRPTRVRRVGSDDRPRGGQRAHGCARAPRAGPPAASRGGPRRSAVAARPDPRSRRRPTRPRATRARTRRRRRRRRARARYQRRGSIRARPRNGSRAAVTRESRGHPPARSRAAPSRRGQRQSHPRRAPTGPPGASARRSAAGCRAPAPRCSWPRGRREAAEPRIPRAARLRAQAVPAAGRPKHRTGARSSAEREEPERREARTRRTLPRLDRQKREASATPTRSRIAGAADEEAAQ